MTIRVTIERIVVSGEGLGPGDRARLQREVERQLADGLAGMPPPDGRAVDRVRTRPRPAPVTPHAVGRAVSDGVAAALRRRT